MLSLKVACLGPIDYIECPNTKEIILNNKIQHFCRELKGEFFKKKIRSKDWKLTKIIEKSEPFIYSGPPVTFTLLMFVFIHISNHSNVAHYDLNIVRIVYAFYLFLYF